MLIFGLVTLGKIFFMGTLLSSFLYPFFLRILEEAAWLQNLTDDYMLCSVFGATLIPITTGYTGEESYAVMTVTHRRFLKQLENIG